MDNLCLGFTPMYPKTYKVKRVIPLQTVLCNFNVSSFVFLIHDFSSTTWLYIHTSKSWA